MSASQNPQPANSLLAHPALLILILAFAPAIGNGMGRFAYSLVLADMRTTLGWSYATAGAMNTLNAIGYLVGAFAAAPFIRRFGIAHAIKLSTLLCLIALVLCAASGNLAVFGFSRLISGIGAAVGLVSGGVLATAIAQSRPSQSAVLIGLFYTGPATGIIVSGLTAPFVLQAFGPGSWWIVWMVLTAISVLMAIPLMLSRLDIPSHLTAKTSQTVPLKPIASYLLGYFLFGAGYIAYMTFMVAYIRETGGSAAAQSAFWCLIGLGGLVSPWAWRGLMSRGQSGTALAVTIGITAFGAVLALFGRAPALLAISAFLFGSAFLAVVTATTAFAKFNYPEDAWPKVIGVLTVTFSLGQILGPLVTGAITDLTGTLTSSLVVSAATLVLSAAISALQRPLKPAA